MALAAAANLTATVVVSGSARDGVEVYLAQEGDDEEDVTTSEEAEEEEAPSPILPVSKEILWGLGSFLVLLVLMRFFLYPKMRKGMDARAAWTAADRAEAEATTAEVEAEVVDYQHQLATIRAEAQRRIDAARIELDGERQDRLGVVNAGIAQRRAEAAAQAEADKQAAMGDLAHAVVEVTAAAARRVLGRDVDPAAVQRAVDEVTSAGVTR